mgnify:CR=1 FL=1
MYIYNIYINKTYLETVLDEVLTLRGHPVPKPKQRDCEIYIEEILYYKEIH